MPEEEGYDFDSKAFKFELVCDTDNIDLKALLIWQAVLEKTLFYVPKINWKKRQTWPEGLNGQLSKLCQ